MAELEIEALSLRFGGLTVLDGISSRGSASPAPFSTASSSRR